MVEQRPFKPKVVGSIPTAPTITPDDSVALTLLGVQKGVEKQGILFPSCSHENGVNPLDGTNAGGLRVDDEPHGSLPAW